MRGKSDQAGCLESVLTSFSSAEALNDSWAITAAPAPSSIPWHRSSMSRHGSARNPSLIRISHASGASRPVGARTKIRSERCCELPFSSILGAFWILYRDSCHAVAKFSHRFITTAALGGLPVFGDRFLLITPLHSTPRI